jgi:hypothetical protein
LAIRQRAFVRTNRQCACSKVPCPEPRGGNATARIHCAYRQRGVAVRGACAAVADVGVEYAFTPNWSAKAEYLYVTAASLDISHNNEIRAGVNYRFGGF